MCYSDYNDIKYLNVFDETKAVYFNGYWRDDFIYKMNSKEELIQSLKDMPYNKINERHACLRDQRWK